jgi:hypothetical protein
MTYTAGQLVQASDYNNFVGGNTANVSGQLNTILGMGYGNAGYGQPATSNVSATISGNLITATQWTTLVNNVNKVRKHQSGAGFTNLSTYVAGTVVNANNAISSNLTSGYSNRLNYQAEGTTTTGSTFSPNFTAPNDTNSATFRFSRTATFASADQARFFFNAGGQLNFVVISVTNTGGTNRGASLQTLAATNFASMRVRAGNNSGRTGAGGTVNSSDTTLGYYKSTSSNATAVSITGTTSSYTSDTCELYVKTNGTQGSNGDAGTTMTLSMQLFSGAQSPAFNDSIDITVNHRIDVIYPSTTFLANTWGSVTIT